MRKELFMYVNSIQLLEDKSCITVDDIEGIYGMITESEFRTYRLYKIEDGIYFENAFATIDLKPIKSRIAFFIHLLIFYTTNMN